MPEPLPQGFNVESLPDGFKVESSNEQLPAGFALEKLPDGFQVMTPKLKKGEKIVLDSADVPKGPTQEDVNLVPGFAAATGFSQKPLGPSLTDAMAPAGSEAAMIRNVMAGKQTPQEKIAAIDALNRQVNANRMAQQQEYENQKAAEISAASDLKVAAAQKMFGPVMGRVSQATLDAVVVPGVKSALDMINGLPNLGKTTKALFQKKLADTIFGKDSEGAKFFEDRAAKELQQVSESVVENNRIKAQVDKLSSLPGRLNLYGDDRNSRVMRFLTAVPEGIGSTLPQMALPSGAGSLVGKALMKSGASEIASLTNGMIVNTLLESGTEAGNAFTEAVSELEADGYSRDEAMRRAAVAGYKTFAGNVALLGLTEAFGTTKDIVKRSMVDGGRALEKQAVKRGWARMAGKTLFDSAKSGLVEGFQERAQSAISGAAKKQAAGEEATILSQYNSPEAQAEGDVGFLIGALTGGAESIAGSKESNVAFKEQQEQAKLDSQFKAAQEAEARAAQAQAQAEPAKPQATSYQSRFELEQRRSEIQPEIEKLQKRLKTMTGKGEKAAKNRESVQGKIDYLQAQYDELGRAIENHVTNMDLAPKGIDMSGIPGMTTPEQRAKLNYQPEPKTPEVIDELRQRDEARGAAPVGMGDLSKLGGMPVEIPPFHEGVSNAAEVRQVQEGRVGEYQGTGQVGQTAEAGGGNRIGQGREVGQAQVDPFQVPQSTIARAEQLKNIAGIVNQAEQNGIQIPEGVKAGVQMRLGEVQNLVANHQAVVEQMAPKALSGDKAAIEAINNSEAKMSAGIKRIQKEVSASVAQHFPGMQEQIAGKTGDFWESTRETWDRQKREMLSGANDISTIIKNSAELAYSIIKDLARGGVKGASEFAKYARQIMDKGQIKQIEDHFGSLEALHDHVMKQNEGRTVKVDGVEHQLTDPTQWAAHDELKADNAARIEELKNRPMTSEDRRVAIAESNKQYEAELRNLVGQKVEEAPAVMEEAEAYGNKFQYLNAGLNPLAMIDQMTNGRLAERLEIKDINNVSTQEYLAAARKLIGGLAKTTEQTAAKLYNKLKDIGITTGQAIDLANYLHSIGKNAILNEDESRIEMRRRMAVEQAIANLSVEVGTRKQTAGRLSKAMLWMAHPFQIDLRHQGFKRVHDAVLDYTHRITQLRRTANDAIKSQQDIVTDEMRKRTTDALVWMSLNEQDLSDAALKDRGLDEHSIVAVRKIRKMVDSFTSQYVASRSYQHKQNMDKLKAQLAEATSKGEKSDIKSITKQMEDISDDYRDEMKILGYDPEKIGVKIVDGNPVLDGDGGFKQRFYFPLMRNGDHMVEIFNSEGKRVANPFIYGDSAEAVEEAFREAAKQSPEVAKILQDAAANGEDLSKYYNLKVLPKLERGQGAIFDGSYLRMIAAAKRIDPGSLSQMEIALSEMIGNESMKAHMQHRTGFPGWSTDLDFIMSAYPRMMANRIAMIENGQKITDALSTIDQHKDNNAYEAAKALKDAALNPGVMSNTARFMGAMDFNLFLGAVPVTPIINRTQPWLVGMPFLSEMYGTGNAARALWNTNGIADHIAAKGMLSRYAFEGLDSMPTQELEALLRDAVTNSSRLNSHEKSVVLNVLIKSALAGDLQAQAENVKGAQDRGTLAEIAKSSKKMEGIGSKAADVAGKASSILGIGMTWSEVANRIQTIAAGALLTDKHGWVEVQEDGTPLLVNGYGPSRQKMVLRNAERLNGAINYTGGRGNLSGWKRNQGLVAQSLGRFKSVIVYGAMGLHTAAIMAAKKAARGDESATLAYLKPYVKHHVLVSAVAGQSATMVGYPLAVALGMALKGMDLEKWFKEVVDDAKKSGVEYLKGLGMDESQAKTAVKAVDRIWNKGLVGMTGADVTASLAPNIIVKGNSLPEAIGFAVAGPSGSAAADSLDKLWKYSSNWEVAATEAAKSFKPRFVKGPMEAAAGKSKIAGEESYELDNLWEKFLRGLSVQIVPVTERREVFGKIIDKAMDKKAVVDTIRKGIQDGALDRKEALDAIRDFNRDKRGKDRINDMDRSKILSGTRMDKKTMRQIEKGID